MGQSASPADHIAEWFGAELPDGWFADAVRVLVDRDEIVLVGPLACPTTDDGADGAVEAVELEAIATFREDTRDHRIAIAARAEALFGRKVSWVAECGSTQQPFTTLSVPVMTRLRMGERRILDTLVAAGVARSRSDALAWCVRLVAQHEGEWLDDLRDALEAVERVRSRRAD